MYGLVATLSRRVAVLKCISGEPMYFNSRRPRRPERVGALACASLPPRSNSEPDPDDPLVHALRARDEHAFEDLISRYYSSMLRLALGFVRSRGVADDVIQECWVAVLSGIHHFEKRSSFRTWLFRILENQARTRAKRESKVLPFSSVGDTAPTDSEIPVWSRAPSRANTPEDDLLASELRCRIDDAVAALPRNQHEVMTLRDIEGWSAKEVCNALNLSPSNQRVLLHRARANVREALWPYVTNNSDEPVHMACAPRRLHWLRSEHDVTERKLRETESL